MNLENLKAQSEAVLTVCIGAAILIISIATAHWLWTH